MTNLLTGNTWALTVRITHWAVATCVLINFFNESGYWHHTIGYGCLLFLIVRLIHGFWLNNTISSKFHTPTITDIKLHLQELKSGQVTQHIGHNPLGQYAVYVIWLLIILIGFTGWLSRTDQFWGEDWPVMVHKRFSTVLQIMTILHLAAVMLMSKYQGKNLIKLIIKGK